MSYEAVVGLEVHAQLLTATKIFCGCRTTFGAAPNTHVCPVCLGLPGALPVLNREAVALGVRAALALGSAIQTMSVFARKHYFYPDLPKGYQISQYDRPFAIGGRLGEVGITRVHLEEDAGKSLHDGFPDADRFSGVDFNRSGVPLVEIVTEPDLRSAADAAECFSRLRAVLVAIGVNDGNMEEGSLRCDANVSVRPAGTTAFGVKTEVKNVNSFRYVQRAIEFEIERQVAILRDGGAVVQETRLWDSAAGRTVGMRSKEEAHDYRYFPEPDLPALTIDAALVENVRSAMPELPDATRARFVAAYALPDYDAGVLTQDPGVAAYFEQAAAAAGNAKAASNWVMGELLRKMKETAVGIREVPLPPSAFARLIVLAESGTISGPIAKELFDTMWTSGRGADELVAEGNLARIDDEGALRAVVGEVLAANAKAVQQYREGKRQTFGYLVGQAMKATRGRANPEIVNALVRRMLETDEPTT